MTVMEVFEKNITAYDDNEPVMIRHGDIVRIFTQNKNVYLLDTKVCVSPFMYILIVPVMLVSSLIIFFTFTISELDILTKLSESNISSSSYNRYNGQFR